MGIPAFRETTADALVSIRGGPEMWTLSGGPFLGRNRAGEVICPSGCRKIRIPIRVLYGKSASTVVGHVVTPIYMLVRIVNADRGPGWRFFHGIAIMARPINLSAKVLPLAWEERL